MMLHSSRLKEKFNKWLFNRRFRKIHTEYYPNGKKKSKGYLIIKMASGMNGMKMVRGSHKVTIQKT